MPRDIPIGNGNVLIAFDKNSILKEFFFPHVGEENHIGESFRLGLWTDNQFTWVPDGWEIYNNYLDDTLVTHVEMLHEGLGIRIVSNDLVDFEKNIYLKQLTVENLWDQERDIKLFLAQDFYIYGNPIGNTAAFKPENRSLLHYKAERYFLVNIWANYKFGIDLYATGNTGVWQDAEDGILSGNPIAQGSVGSVLAIPLTLPVKGTQSCYYWISIGKNWEEVQALDQMVKKKTPNEIFRRTADYWKLWADKELLNYALLPDSVARLYRRSLLICRTQMNNCGSIIAANDSDAINFNRDTYSYMWPRDGAMVSYALTLAGYDTANFFRFCEKILQKEGYFLHKYSPTGALGSSWHPWVKDHKAQLPIQEDETALVIWALWHHYKRFKDLELIRYLYEPLIKKAADFMMNYRNLETGLPLPSFDLWEERQGILTFTASAVYGGLMAASHFAEEFGETGLAKDYAEGAKKLRQDMDKHLYLPDEQRFARMIQRKQDETTDIDAAIDASLYGIFAFGAYKPDELPVQNTMRQIFETLEVNGGICRYLNDSYYRDNDQSLSNPWFITTLWKAQYLAASAKTSEDLKAPLAVLEWIADRALPSGVLAEQLHPETLQPISVSPLTWSHGSYIIAVQEYLNKRLEIEKCPGCGKSKDSKIRTVRDNL